MGHSGTTFLVVLPFICAKFENFFSSFLSVKSGTTLFCCWFPILFPIPLHFADEVGRKGTSEEEKIEVKSD